MSILQADGLEFGDGSILESLYGIIPQSKNMVFYQAAAPTGWTKLTQVSAPGDLDGSAIRVTSGAGGSVVGTTDFTTAMPANSKAFDSVSPAIAAGSVGPHTLTLTELATHDHQVGAREVDDGPPAPTAYQAPAQASYPDRTPYTAQRAYQQPSVYQQPVIYQQPDAYQQPQTRQSIVPQQNPGFYQQPNNPRNQIPYQQPHFVNNPNQYTQNRRVAQPSPNRSPTTTNDRGQVSFQQTRFQPNPQNRWFRQRVVAFPQNPRANPVNRQRPGNVQTNKRPNSRPDRRRQGRTRRQPRYQQPSNKQKPRTTQVPERIYGFFRSRTPDTRQHQFNARRTAPLQGQGPIRVPQQRQTKIQQNRVQSRNVQNITPARRTMPRRNPIPFRSEVRFRTPTTFRQPSNTTVTANKRVSANTNVNANTNVPVRVTQVYQQSNVNYSTYPQPLIVPGDQIRGDNINTPNTSSVGGGNAHTHPFTGDDFGPQISAPSGFSLRVQYIDVIVCSFD